MNETQHHIFGEKLYHVTYGFGMYDRAYHYERKKMNKIDMYFLLKLEYFLMDSK